MNETNQVPGPREYLKLIKQGLGEDLGAITREQLQELIDRHSDIVHHSRKMGDADLVAFFKYRVGLLYAELERRDLI